MSVLSKGGREKWKLSEKEKEMKKLPLVRIFINSGISQVFWHLQFFKNSTEFEGALLQHTFGTNSILNYL